MESDEREWRPCYLPGSITTLVAHSTNSGFFAPVGTSTATTPYWPASLKPAGPLTRLREFPHIHEPVKSTSCDKLPRQAAPSK